MQKTIPYEQLKRIHCELAKRDFYHFCKLKAPNFYDVEYLEEMCQALQDFISDDNELLILNLPPRFGKSRTAGLFVQWLLGQDNTIKIISASYNEILSRKFSKTARNSIQEQASSKNRIVYSDIFPETKIARGSAQANLWKLEGSDEDNYLATSPGSTLTGMGGNCIIIDDLVKNSYEAHHAGILEDHFEWFTDTLYSRLEGLSKVILIMTRWATKDLAGRLIDMYNEQGRKYKLISKKACDNNKMLNDKVLPFDRYQMLIDTIGEEIVRANYDQEPIDLKGTLYQNFITYKELPAGLRIEAMCDTADQGTDYLVNIIYGIEGTKAYIIDVYYTQDPMNITEKELPKLYTKYNVEKARFESNFGGEAFRKVIERLTRDLGNNTTKFLTFTQTKNKEARILSNSTNVERQIYFPEHWNKMFPKFYKDVTEFQRQGNNLHDCAPDTLTMVVEHLKSKPTNFFTGQR